MSNPFHRPAVSVVALAIVSSVVFWLSSSRDDVAVAQSTVLPPIFQKDKLVQPATGALPGIVYRVVDVHQSWVKLRLDEQATKTALQATPGVLGGGEDEPISDGFWSAMGMQGEWWTNMATNTNMWKEVSAQ